MTAALELAWARATSTDTEVSELLPVEPDEPVSVRSARLRVPRRPRGGPE